ncbi:MAG: DUF3109 family protein [Flavobacteriales bacterium]|nr:DUF3109 family protein [Flavobacteriales bacterium]
MIEIDDKLISLDLFEKKFVCDLNACKGACCVEGDAGAPLSMEEIDTIEENIEVIKPYMRTEGIEVISQSGIFYMDEDNEPVTSLVNNKECAFVTFDQNNIAKCAIEQAHADGKLNFKKPISCHLYPIRVAKYRAFEAINYSEWHICKPACECGKNLNVSVYKFLKEPIIRKWGESFYKELENIDKELSVVKKSN